MPRFRAQSLRKILAMTVTVAVGLVVGLVGAPNIRRFVVEPPPGTAPPDQRQAIYDLLQPVALRNCQFERFGEARDGGYLMCANLLNRVEVAYSYGIGGYDKWGCDVSTRRDVAVHQYDCFELTEPSCSTGRAVFHAECVGPARSRQEGRLFDTLAHQFEANGDTSKRIALKIDVEGAEWDTFLSAPADVLSQIDQLAVEFHGFETDTSLAVIERLVRVFEVVHVHYNNFSCLSTGFEPFPAWAYEVTFVNKDLAVVDPSATAERVHPLDARNDALLLDCQR